MKLLLRPAALVASVALAVSGVVLVTSPAQAAADPRPASIGADWLAGELTNGLMHNPSFGGFDDYGLSIDTGFALDAAGGHGADVTDISTALAAAIGNYVTGEAFGDAGSLYAGPAAKAAVFAALAGDDPTAYGGRDLVGDVEMRVADSAPITGRIEDESTFGDFANAIGQAFAVNALSEASSPKAPAALAFLLKQQCAAGYFRLFLTEDKSASDQTCEGGRASGASAPDPDVTSTAIRMLIPQLDNPAVARAVGKAEAWLLSRQRTDGSFVGGTTTAVPNANSTGLAGWALGLLGDTEAATRAAVWVRQQQADEVSTCSNALSEETGAIGYNPEAVGIAATGTTGNDVVLPVGITPERADQWRRATSQGLAVLQWAPSVTPDLELTGPTGYVRAARYVTLRVSGAVPGEKICVRGTGSLRVVAGFDGTVTRRVYIPGGTLFRTMTARNRTGSTDQTVVKALGAKTFRVTLSKRTPRRFSLVKVRATGLAPGEKARLVFRGVRLRTGVANANGVYAVEFNVRRTLGKGTVVVNGQFVGRRGTATLTVIR